MVTESEKITNQNDLLIIFDSQLNQPNGMIKHHIDSINEFNFKGIKQIIESGFKIQVEINNERTKTVEDRSIKLITINANITDVELTHPTTQNYISQKSQILTPTEAHQKDLTYSSPMYINATIVATAYKHDGTTEVKKSTINRYRIGKIPIMVKSKLCNTFNKSRETLLNLNEDPLDVGGYFIIKGNEWVIDNIESMTFNSPREFANIGYKNERCRGDFISKPGDGFENSFNLITKYLTNDNIIVEITNNKFRDISIPFFVLFRAFGVCSDKEIIEHITYSFDETNPTVKKMLTILERAFHSKYVDMPDAYDKHTSDEIIELIGNKINNYYVNDLQITNINTRKYTNSSIRQILDNDILPHVGKTPNDRYKKVRFLGHLIRRLLMVFLKLIPSTDRDSYKNKRINPAGVSYAKIFKTHFNFAIVQSVKRQFRRDFKNTSFSNINLEHSFTNAIYSHEFERALTQAIITGDKSISIRRKQIANNLSSQQLHRKNLINQLSTLRNINTKNTSSAKQSARANEMRRVHSSMIGYVCCVQSADTGEKVGMQKQMAISANICPSGSSELLKDKLLRDSDLLPLDEIQNIQIYRNKLTKVFVNGDWIGCCVNPFDFRSKYVNMRRKQQIEYLTTISLEILTNEIYFWVDIGRITRPLLIVYQNDDGSQYIKLTKTHIQQLHSSEIGIDDLIKQEIIEYISPEEQINCFIAKDLNTLIDNEKSELIKYTHVDIPQSIIGLPGLTSPFANHNQVARVVFQTNQVKQTCGWPVFNWPHRVYKELHYQTYKEMPLIKTISNKYTPSDGSNAIVAIMTYGGYNQEDSLILNQGAIDKGLFTTYHFSFEKTELEKNEEFANPNPLETIDIKAYSNYEKLDNGKVPIGTRIEYGDIIIGKIAKLPKTEIVDNKKYIDRSIVYKYNEPAYVSNIIEGRNEEDNIFCKIVFRSVRKCEIGDKFCVDDTHEVLTEKGWKFINKVSTKDKIATLSDNKLLYEAPSEMNVFDSDEDLYSCTSDKINITCTLNHKFYVKDNDKYNLTECKNLLDTPYICKKDCVNDISEDILFTSEIGETFDTFNILKLLGLFINYGKIKNNVMLLTSSEVDVKTEILSILQNLNLEYNMEKNTFSIENTYIINKFKTSNQKFPSFVWKLNQNNCKLLLDNIIRQSDNMYITKSKTLSDELQKLSIHSGYNSNIHLLPTNKKSKMYKIIVLKLKNELEPTINKKSITTNIKIINKKCKVYCPTVSSGIFMIRKDGIAHWTGNSSRSGQKGTIGIIYRDSDMPFTSSGMKPDLIFNPHSIPTRMTMSKIFESMASKYCAVNGSHSDGTMFKNFDTDDLANNLTKIGYNKNGVERLYNGMTGKYIDCEIFIGPIYYQRLQKFTIDTVYSHKTCPTDVVVRQPLDGKSSRGGLRIGEMETNVLAISSVKFLQEKMVSHSDKYDYYVCNSCHHKAIVNEKYNIYKCHYCGDNSDIFKVNGTWSTHLFFQEINSMGIGVKYYKKPDKFEVLMPDTKNNITIKL